MQNFFLKFFYENNIAILLDGQQVLAVGQFACCSAPNEIPEVSASKQ